MGTGRARIITDAREKKAALAVIMRQYSGGKYAFSEKSLARMVAVQIDITCMTGKQSGYA
jgi:nitroimidazol reductase NimA-like FMN-containing flavoprotein (pyridoxamine 5'-phosphate oxidase superfamily)